MGIIKAAKLAFDYLRYGEEGEEPGSKQSH